MDCVHCGSHRLYGGLPPSDCVVDGDVTRESRGYDARPDNACVTVLVRLNTTELGDELAAIDCIHHSFFLSRCCRPITHLILQHSCWLVRMPNPVSASLALSLPDVALQVAARLQLPTGPPLDFSFQELDDVSELPDHEVNDPPPAASGKLISISQQPPCGLRLAYNNLTTVDALPSLLQPSPTAHALLAPHPSSPLHSLSLLTISLLDLSSNQLTAVPSCLVQLPQLTTLYLHSNRLTTLHSLHHLLPLTHLHHLTLHGNPVTQPPISCTPASSTAVDKSKAGGKGAVRLEVLGRLSGKSGVRLRELDFVGVVESEWAAGVRWMEARRRKRVKKVDKAVVEEEEQ